VAAAEALQEALVAVKAVKAVKAERVVPMEARGEMEERGVGVAAMDVCRPLPFRALPRPRTTNLVSRGLAGLFAENRES
jgi:hypothetical protein